MNPAMRVRRLARRNPSRSPVAAAAGTDALFAVVGGAIGAATHTPRAQGAVAGAQGGLALASLGSLVVAAVSKPLREQALVTAGVGLGGILLLGLVASVTASA